MNVEDKWCIRCTQPGHLSHACKMLVPDLMPAAAPVQPPSDPSGAYGYFLAGLPVRNMIEAVTATGRATLNDMLAQLSADTDGPIV